MGLDRPGLLLTASTLIVPATVHGNGDPRSLTLLGLPKTSTSRVRTPHQTEIIYFKLCKSRIPVIEQALETATRMPGSDIVSYTHLRAHETRHDLVCRL